ncbi:leucine-rich repeat-containing protein 71-like [Plodia interpunctella]|uniref:leucine-rich repeat-containing protein 71-like n=1 Tax=Plodia interpunctella TaxID=58824 RepID=UPI002367B336|nr:leucine-rich repeat-containing protein 71-like [Plodia interpunctella]
MKTTASMRSLASRSRKSIVTGVSVRYGRVYEKVQEFETWFPTICRKYGLLQTVSVKKEYARDDYIKHLQMKGKPKEGRSRSQSITSRVTNATVIDDKETATTGSTERTNILEDDTILLTVVYDNSERFIEIDLIKLDDVPRELIKLIGFIAKFYHTLKKIKVQFCTINDYTVYELSKLICLSTLCEVDLDGSALATGNYGILFDSGRLNSISLSKCCINDVVVEEIARKLCFGGIAESNLYTLNLSTNRITDVGAKYLSIALRTNRTLRYLNLADNRITDEGACSILDVFKEFQLTSEEIVQKSQRYMTYERQRLAIYYKYLATYTNRNDDENSKDRSSDRRKSMAARRSSKSQKSSPKSFTLEDYKNKAECLAGEMMGPFRDPYQSNLLSVRDSKYYCIGNMALCFLNLSFNNLAYPSVQRLLNVLQYQRDSKRLGQTGLIRVIIRGNNLPISCVEYAKIDDLLTKCMMSLGGKAFSERRKSRASRISVMPEKMLLLPR